MKRYTMTDNLVSAGIGITIGLVFALCGPVRVWASKSPVEVVGPRLGENLRDVEAVTEAGVYPTMSIAYEDALAAIAEGPAAEDPVPEISRDVELLAALVHAEAGNQDMKGRRLVADTVLNRVRSADYPDSIEGVIYQRGQFSTVSDGALDRALAGATTDADREAARLAIEEGPVDQFVLFFCSTGYSAYGTPAFKYQDHYFCYK